jgi:hypothetical protein
MGLGTSGPVLFMYDDTLANQLIVGGSFLNVEGILADRIGTWDGTSWDTLATGIINSSPVLSACRFQGDIYTEGALVQGRNALLKLTDNGWQEVGVTSNSTISGLRVIGDRIYVVGFFDSIAGMATPGIAAWDGTQWFAIGNDINEVYFSDVAEFEGELYVVGKFDNGGGLVNIAKLVDNTWQPVGGGIPAFDGWASDLFVYKEKLYVAGYFDQWQGNAGHNIMAWDGNTWDGLQGGVQHTNGAGFIRGVSTDDEYLYVAGLFNYSGDLFLNGLARWNGSNWCAINNPYSGGSTILLTHFQDKFILAQSMWDSVNGVAQYIASSDYFVDSCSLVGIEEEPYFTDDVSVYPNPATSTITISTPQGSITAIALFDITGRAVNAVQLTSTNETITLDVSGLPAGIYFGRVLIGELERSFKWVKQ